MADDARRPPHVRWGEDPPLRGGPFYPILSPKPRQTLKLIVLSRELLKVHLHWGQTTFPCIEPKSDCPGCTRLGQRPKFAGFLAVRFLYTQKLGIATVTDYAYRNCAMLQDRSRDLRGYELRLTRDGDFKNSKVSAELIHPGGKPNVRKPFDLETALYRIWGLLRDSEVLVDASPVDQTGADFQVPLDIKLGEPPPHPDMIQVQPDPTQEIEFKVQQAELRKRIGQPFLDFGKMPRG